jgi:hypothetical protein
MVYSPDHSRAHKSGHVFEHILVWERSHGPLLQGWHVHHMNGIKDDNRLENLMALSPRSHREHHARTVDLLRARIRKLERELSSLKSRSKRPRKKP